MTGGFVHQWNEAQDDHWAGRRLGEVGTLKEREGGSRARKGGGRGREGKKENSQGGSRGRVEAK